MELIAILRLLWRRRLLVVLAALVSAGCGLMLGSGPTQVTGVGSSRLVVNTPQSQVVDATSTNKQTLVNHAPLVADLLATAGPSGRIAALLGIPAKQLSVVDKRLTSPNIGTPLPTGAAEASLSTGARYSLVLNPYRGPIPIVEFNAQAPTVAGAQRLLEAAATVLEQTVNTAKPGPDGNLRVSGHLRPTRAEGRARPAQDLQGRRHAGRVRAAERPRRPAAQATGAPPAFVQRPPAAAACRMRADRSGGGDDQPLHDLDLSAPLPEADAERGHGRDAPVDRHASAVGPDGRSRLGDPQPRHAAPGSGGDHHPRHALRRAADVAARRQGHRRPCRRLAGLDLRLPEPTPNVPVALSEPTSEKRSYELANQRRPFLIEIQARPQYPIIDIYAQAPTPLQAQRLADATVQGLKDYISSLASAHGQMKAAQQTQILELGQPQGEMISTGTKLVAGLTFFAAFIISWCGLLLLRRWRRWRAGEPLDRPRPARRVSVPKGLRQVGDWPRTTRVLPWMLAFFIAMLWLVPFEQIQLDVSLPIGLPLDRLILPFLIGVLDPRPERRRPRRTSAAPHLDPRSGWCIHGRLALERDSQRA